MLVRYDWTLFAADPSCCEPMKIGGDFEKSGEDEWQVRDRGGTWKEVLCCHDSAIKKPCKRKISFFSPIGLTATRTAAGLGHSPIFH